MTGEGFRIGDMHAGSGDWVAEAVHGRVRVRATAAGSHPVFVGIARQSALSRYLSGVRYDEVSGGTRTATSVGPPGSVAVAPETDPVTADGRPGD